MSWAWRFWKRQVLLVEHAPDPELMQIAERLTHDCCGVEVYGYSAVYPEEVRQICREYLRLTREQQEREQ